VAQRSAQEVLALQRHGGQLQRPLDHPGGPGGRGDVVGEEQQPARAQDPAHLGDGLAVVGDRAQRERADHGVEAGVGKRQGESVGLAQVRVAAEPGRVLAGDGEHGRAEVDPPRAVSPSLPSRPLWQHYHPRITGAEITAAIAGPAGHAHADAG
jgi:hypothetical protein